MGKGVWITYKDPYSGWSKKTKGYSYGKKCHMSLDVYSHLIMEWIFTRGNIHDSRASHRPIDSLRNFAYLIAD
ncbi:transposase [Thermoplasma acidophilum]|uniref:transposase n=1 Tax=Thermoplasma acidophilum TaxID=2303 RepID=UPI0012E9D049|nr:transposase [Thermoplasma acidophilum]